MTNPKTETGSETRLKLGYSPNPNCCTGCLRTVADNDIYIKGFVVEKRVCVTCKHTLDKIYGRYFVGNSSTHRPIIEIVDSDSAIVLTLTLKK